MVRRLLVWVVVVLLGFGTCTAGCRQPAGSAKPPSAEAKAWDQVVEAAKKEGVVRWYTSMPTWAGDYICEEFTNRYGIKVERYRAGAVQVIQKFVTEREGGIVNADVIESVHPAAFADMGRRGWLAAVGSELPTWGSIDARFKEPRGRWAAVRIFGQGIIWNTDRVTDAEAPREWQDLLDPKWKGKIALANPLSAGGPSLWTVYVVNSASYGPGFLSRLAANQLTQFPEVGSMFEAVASGQKAVGIPASDFWYFDYKNKGAHLGFAYPSTATVASVACAAVLEGCAHPNAAKLFLNFLLEESTQKYLAERGGLYSANISVATPDWKIPLERLAVTDYESVAQDFYDRSIERAAEALGLK